jgi:hypothetical protein
MDYAGTVRTILLGLHLRRDGTRNSAASSDGSRRKRCYRSRCANRLHPRELGRDPGRRWHCASCRSRSPHRRANSRTDWQAYRSGALLGLRGRCADPRRCGALWALRPRGWTIASLCELPLFGLSFGFVHPMVRPRCVTRGGSSITMGLSTSPQCWLNLRIDGAALDMIQGPKPRLTQLCESRYSRN